GWHALTGRSPNRSWLLRWLAFWLVLGPLTLRPVQAAYEVPDPAYNPPTHYYDTASGTGFTLRTNLHNIISAGFTARTYGQARWAFGSGGTDTQGTHPGGFLDMDPANSNNIIRIYTHDSVNGTWANGAAGTFNREHLWPKAWLNLTSSQVDNNYSG